MNSWYTENTYPTIILFTQQAGWHEPAFSWSSSTAKREIKERKPMAPGSGHSRQPGASHFKGAARQKGFKNLSQGPTTGWLLS